MRGEIKMLEKGKPIKNQLYANTYLIILNGIVLSGQRNIIVPSHYLLCCYEIEIWKQLEK